MTMYADSVFQNQGDQIRIRNKDLISISVYPLHAEYSQRSVRFPGPPGAVIRRLLTGQLAWESNPPKDLHGPPRTLVLPDGSIIVRFAGHGTIAGATCLLDPHCVSRSPEHRIMARRSSHARSQNEST